MDQWIKTWRSDVPPDLPGLAAYMDGRLEKMLFIGACSSSIKAECPEFRCKFGVVSEILTALNPDYQVVWWSVPSGSLPLIGQLPEIVIKIIDAKAPAMLPVGSSPSLPQAKTILDEDLI